MSFLRCSRLVLKSLAAFALLACANAQVKIEFKRDYLPQTDPQITLATKPNAPVRLHFTRPAARFMPDATGAWKPTIVLMHAWADFRADDKGVVRISESTPEKGTYSVKDGQGLIWSLRLFGQSGWAASSDQAKTFEQRARETNADALWAQALDGEIEAPTLLASTFVKPSARRVLEPRFAGMYAAPKLAAGGKRVPAIILLHGSEGGSFLIAQSDAEAYAAQGYAALSLIYFTRDPDTSSADPRIRKAHVETPLELIEDARAWLAQQPEVDASRTGIFGISKGAEFTLLAASYFPKSFRAAVACVPTDQVWEGYTSETYSTDKSSWSFAGKPLPFIPLRQTQHRTNTERYLLSRGDAERAGTLSKSRIPVEKSAAPLLLVAGERDEVWASAPMSREVAKQVGSRAKTLIFPTAGHMICANPEFPLHLYGEQSQDPRDKILIDEGAAAAATRRAVLEFFKVHL
jgi:dienelactone hydrolase